MKEWRGYRASNAQPRCEHRSVNSPRFVLPEGPGGGFWAGGSLDLILPKEVVMGYPRKGPQGWLVWALASLLGLSPPPLLWLGPCVSHCSPSPGIAQSQTPFPAILHKCDNRTMSLPEALPRSCWSHRASPKGGWTPGRSSDAGNLPGTFKGRGSREDGLEFSSFWRSGSPNNCHPSPPAAQKHTHATPSLSGCPRKAQLIWFEFQLCHLFQETLE